METNEIIKNEEVNEVVEGIVENVNYGGNCKKAVIIGLVVGVAGTLAYNHGVKPLIAKIKDRLNKQEDSEETVESCDGEVVEQN